MANEVEIISIRGNEAEIRVGERTHFVPFVFDGARVQFAFDGEIYSVEVPQRGARVRTRPRDHSLEAPMPGLVLKVLVKPGATVEKGMPLIVLEAMKMEHAILAPRAGTVAEVNCVEGEMVQPGTDLVRMKAEG